MGPWSLRIVYIVYVQSIHMYTEYMHFLRHGASAVVRFSKRFIIQNVGESLVCDGGRNISEDQETRREPAWVGGRPEGDLIKLAPSIFCLEPNRHIQ